MSIIINKTRLDLRSRIGFEAMLEYLKEHNGYEIRSNTKTKDEITHYNRTSAVELFNKASFLELSSKDSCFKNNHKFYALEDELRSYGLKHFNIIYVGSDPASPYNVSATAWLNIEKGFGQCQITPHEEYVLIHGIKVCDTMEDTSKITIRITIPKSGTEEVYEHIIPKLEPNPSCYKRNENAKINNKIRI